MYISENKIEPLPKKNCLDLSHTEPFQKQLGVGTCAITDDGFPRIMYLVPTVIIFVYYIYFVQELQPSPRISHCAVLVYNMYTYRYITEYDIGTYIIYIIYYYCAAYTYYIIYY